MRKPLYNAPPAPLTGEQFQYSRRVVLVVSLCFILVGGWDLWNGSPLILSPQRSRWLLELLTQIFGSNIVGVAGDLFFILLGGITFFACMMSFFREKPKGSSGKP